MAAVIPDSRRAEMFRPPINRAMKNLDRSLFSKEVLISAARVLEKTSISRLRADLQNDILKASRMSIVRDDPVKKGFKSLLLRPEINVHGIYTTPFKMMHFYKTLTVAQILQHGARSCKSLSIPNKLL